MNAIDQGKKNDTGAVCDESGMILCEHPQCNEVFEKKNGKKYHSTDCKNDHHRMEREAGKKVLAKGKIKAARLENSPRLQRVARFLSDGKVHTTIEIQDACRVCAVGTIKSELIDPVNGFDIVCTQIGKGIFEYKMLGGQSQLLRLV